MFKNRLIPHPTDFSSGSSAAFETACSLASDQHARLVVLHVVPPPGVYGVALSSREDDGVCWHELQDRLHTIKPTDPSIDVQYRLEEGDPAGMIVDIAALLECDLIVMGTHGRSGLGRLVMGSVAEQVLRKALCPVLTVKARPEPTAGQRPQDNSFE